MAVSQSANIGANFSDYQGNPNLGGSSLGVAKIDTRPLEDLAKYTMLYNREEYNQRQKNADEKIAEFAKLATIHVNDLRGKDKEEILAQLNDVMTFAQDYAKQIPKNPKEKIEHNLEWQKKTIGLFNNFESGKSRSVKYLKELDSIDNDKTISEATKAEKRKELDELFDKTKISEQFSGVPEYPLTNISIPQPLTLKANIIQEAPNANLDETLTIFNYKANPQLAFNLLNGLDAVYLDEKTPKGQTPQARQQRTIESEAKIWRDTAGVLNGIVQNYQTTDPTTQKIIFDAKRFEEENADNKVVMGAYNALKNMDADAKAKFAQAQQGKLSDKGFGFNIPGNVVADDFRQGFVDFTKPIPAEKILTAGMFSKYLGDVVEKKVDQTNRAIQQSNASLGWARFNYGTREDKLGASSVLNEAIDIINKGVEVKVDVGGGNTKIVKRISDPFLLQKFGNIDKEGNVTNVADAIEYDDDTDQVKFIYYSGKTKSGKNIIDETKTKSLDKRGWLKEITKRSFPNKDIGGINTNIDEFLNSNGNKLIKNNQQPKTQTYNLGGQTITQEQIEKGAKKYKMTVDAYKKSIGL